MTVVPVDVTLQSGAGQPAAFLSTVFCKAHGCVVAAPIPVAGYVIGQVAKGIAGQARPIVKSLASRADIPGTFVAGQIRPPFRHHPTVLDLAAYLADPFIPTEFIKVWHT